MTRLPARLALLGTLVLALACGDDGDDDTAAGTTVADPTAASTAGADSTAAGTTEPPGSEATGTPAECEAVTCNEGELCVATGTCSEEPFCIAADMVPCDFGTGLCTAPDVCSGPIDSGVLLCQTCL